MTCKVEVLPDLPALIARSQDLVTQKIQAAIAQQGYCTLALAGGSTPKPLYEALAEQDLPWHQLYFFWGDERYVPPDHPDSNLKMAKQAWLDRVSVPTENIYPMPTLAADPLVAATEYDQTLRNFFQEKTGRAEDFPALDLILLGMGDDGHTASLFPQTEALQVCDRRITVGNKSGQPRITFTVPLINSARTILFLVSGENKQQALTQVFADEPDYDQYPASLIQPQQGELWWLLDQAAGQKLAVA